MRLDDHIAQITGLSFDKLFWGPSPLVVLRRDGAGQTTIQTWKVPNVPQPSAADIAAALAMPEPAPAGNGAST